MAVDQDASEAEPARDGSAPAWDEGAAAAPDVVDFDALNAALGALPPAGGSTPQLADSEGRSSASYASARPHVIPATRAPGELNAPAVIVAQDDTVPSKAPKMTAAMPPVVLPAQPRSVPPPANPYQTEPYVAIAQPHPAENPNAGHTMPLAAAQRPRRPRTPTIVVRPRGPSRTKRALVFLFLLVIFVVGGTTLLFFKSPGLVRGLGKAPAPPVSAHP